jgi:REP element-mobilizing transposase RayT
MKHSSVRLSPGERAVVEEAIRGVCAYRDWQLIAVNCRTNHVHVVVRTDGTGPEQVMNQMKAYATRALRRAGFARARVWTRGGSTRYLNTPVSLQTAVQYVRFQSRGPGRSV